MVVDVSSGRVHLRSLLIRLSNQVWVNSSEASMSKFLRIEREIGIRMLVAHRLLLIIVELLLVDVLVGAGCVLVIIVPLPQVLLQSNI